MENESVNDDLNFDNRIQLDGLRDAVENIKA